MTRVEIKFANGNEATFYEKDMETAEEKFAILTDACPGQITELNFYEEEEG